MELNPYQSPDAVIATEAVWSEQESQLWKVALWQKYLMWLLLVFVGSNVALAYYSVLKPSGARNGQTVEPSMFPLLIFLLSWSVVTICAVRMELIQRSKLAAAGVMIGMLVPGINLIVLLCINGSVTNFLRKHRVRVGLFGAEMIDIRRNLKKKVGEIDPDKNGTFIPPSQSTIPMVAQVAGPLPMVAQAIPIPPPSSPDESSTPEY